MRQMTCILLALCVLGPATAHAAQPSAPASKLSVDCNSAAVLPANREGMDEICRAEAASQRARLAGGVTQETVAPKSRAALEPQVTAAADVLSSRTTPAALNFGAVPTWSDAEIMAQFAALRDARYMVQSQHPDVPRRMSWLYPEDGCYASADQMAVRAAEAGKTRPYKFFAFSRDPPLRFATENSTRGAVMWHYRVAPLVKNSAGEPIVLDPGVSPCKPLPWKKWLALMVDDMAAYDRIDAGNGVVVADSWAYSPFSLVTGEPSHAVQSRTEEEGTYLFYEWERQKELGRDPYTVLGPTPPWSGYNCVSTETEMATIEVPANTTRSVAVRCPFATVAVGGGMGLGSSDLDVTKNLMNGNGWQIEATNNRAASSPLTASAVCLTGAPSNASISTIVGGRMMVNPGSSATSTADCGMGTLIGGGYTTTLGNASVMRIFTNGRTNGTSNVWQASGYNTTTAATELVAYGYCLLNTNFTFSQTSGSLTEEGIATATCPIGSAMGGGFAFPMTTDYSVMNTRKYGNNSYQVDMTPAPAGGDTNARAYAECLTHP